MFCFLHRTSSFILVFFPLSNIQDIEIFYSKQQIPYSSFSGLLFPLFIMCIDPHENEVAVSLMLIFLYVQYSREESYQ